MTAAGILARLTFRRILRGRTHWVALFIAALPALVGAFDLSGDPDLRAWEELFSGPFLAVLAIVPPLHLAAAVAEEVEDRTLSYLWSRPIPRWSLCAGKLLAGVPTVALLLGASSAAAFAVVFAEPGAHLGVLARALLATACGAAAAGAVSVGLGSLLPRQALPVSIAYLLLVDLPVGQVPFALANLSVTHHVSEIALGEIARPLLWLLGLAAVWFAVALLRTSRLEA